MKQIPAAAALSRGKRPAATRVNATKTRVDGKGVLATGNTQINRSTDNRIPHICTCIYTYKYICRWSGQNKIGREVLYPSADISVPRSSNERSGRLSPRLDVCLARLNGFGFPDRHDLQRIDRTLPMLGGKGGATHSNGPSIVSIE